MRVGLMAEGVVYRYRSLACLLVGVLLWGGVNQASAQLSDSDLEALRARGKAEGWTFTIRESEATHRPLSELCGELDTPSPVAGEESEFEPPAYGLRDLPSSWDWRAHNGCTPIRNQGGCGSCWAFSAVGAVESSVLINDGISTNLSEQWLVSCTQAGSCSGGWHNAALCVMRGRGNCVDSCGDQGAVLESAFPYVGWDRPCGCPYAHPYWIDGYALVGDRWDIDAIKQAIYERGPVSTTVAVDGPFQGYGGGVFNACAGTTINHAVVLVGWDDNMGSDGVWILRNSWGSGWGDGGYMYIEYGCNKVGSSTYCVYYRYDCNQNGIRDDWDLADCDGSPWCSDCDDNGLLDVCDIARQRSHDCDGNGVPDECEIGFGGSGRLYVDATASGSHSGANWTNAINELWTAVCYAQTTPAVTEIWVAKGRYAPAEVGGYRDWSFQLRDGLTLRGGFAGTETSLAQRDLSNPANCTILSGDLNGDDQPGFVNNGENSYHVVTATDIGPTAVLDGFTIMGGNADGDSPDDAGGGMYNFNADPTIINCAFLGNHASRGGGAMRNDASGVVIGTCSPTITNCIFSGNDSDFCGGAIHNLGTNLGPASPTLTNCTLTQNAAEVSGGIYTEVYGAPGLTNCVLWGNTDVAGQGEMTQIGGWAVVNYCCLEGLSGNFGGTGNVGSAPGFVDAAGPDGIAGTLDDNLRLTAGSAAIDSGDNSAVPGDVTTDLDGYPRFVDDPGMQDDGSPPGGEPFVDMGAYEFQGSTCFGDLDGDGDVDLADLSTLLAGYGTTSGATYAEGDLDGNGAINLADLGALLGVYGQPCQ